MDDEHELISDAADEQICMFIKSYAFYREQTTALRSQRASTKRDATLRELQKRNMTLFREIERFKERGI